MTVSVCHFIRCVAITKKELFIHLKNHAKDFWNEFLIFCNICCLVPDISSKIDWKSNAFVYYDKTTRYSDTQTELSLDDVKAKYHLIDDKLTSRHIIKVLGCKDWSVVHLLDKEFPCPAEHLLETIDELFCGFGIGYKINTLSSCLTFNSYPHSIEDSINCINLGTCIKSVDMLELEEVDLINFLSEDELKNLALADKELERLGFDREMIKTITVPDDCSCCS